MRDATRVALVNARAWCAAARQLQKLSAREQAAASVSTEDGLSMLSGARNTYQTNPIKTTIVIRKHASASTPCARVLMPAASSVTRRPHHVVRCWIQELFVSSRCTPGPMPGHHPAFVADTACNVPAVTCQLPPFKH